MQIRSSAKAATSRPGKQPEPEINVTPLVDVVLVLLIIFMVVAPNMQQEAVRLPEVHKPDEKKLQNAIEIEMNAQGILLVEDQEVAREALVATVSALHAAKPERALVLKADAGLPYGRVRDVFGSLQRAGLTNVNLKVATHKREET